MRTARSRARWAEYHRLREEQAEAAAEREAERQRIDRIHLQVYIGVQNDIHESMKGKQTMPLNLSNIRAPSNKAELGKLYELTASISGRLTAIHSGHAKKAESIEAETANLIAAMPANVRSMVTPELNKAKNLKLAELRKGGEKK